ncbi:hypothetical protein ZIOFF_031725 [Zingiber officinale]|uniref:Uncharacterized protein n=1 Tax=Zingiber officinale TaxID=94328 RepID=A0A8J5GF98_ZINOF|nr:hypothetical protein ZIOFF_031725 [Zingiber officinale]
MTKTLAICEEIDQSCLPCDIASFPCLTTTQGSRALLLQKVLSQGTAFLFIPFSYLTVESKQYTPTKVGNTRSFFSLDLSMGNCMERCGGTRQKKGEESGPEKGDDGGCKVKILLTRKELEWLFPQEPLDRLQICVRGSENTGETCMTFNNLRFRYGINIPSIVAMASSEEMCQLSSKLEGRGVGLQSNKVEAICAEGKAAKGAVVVLRQLTSVMKLETDVID